MLLPRGLDRLFFDDAIWRWTLGSSDGRSSSASTSTYVVDAMLDDGFYVGYYVVDALLLMLMLCWI